MGTRTAFGVAVIIGAACVHISCAGHIESDSMCLLIGLDEGEIRVIDSDTNAELCKATLVATRGDGVTVDLRAGDYDGRSVCPFRGFAEKNDVTTGTATWSVKATAMGYQDVVQNVVVPYDVPSCQVHGVDAVIRMHHQ